MEMLGTYMHRSLRGKGALPPAQDRGRGGQAPQAREPTKSTRLALAPLLPSAEPTIPTADARVRRPPTSVEETGRLTASCSGQDRRLARVTPLARHHTHRTLHQDGRSRQTATHRGGTTRPGSRKRLAGHPPHTVPPARGSARQHQSTRPTRTLSRRLRSHEGHADGDTRSAEGRVTTRRWLMWLPAIPFTPSLRLTDLELIAALQLRTLSPDKCGICPHCADTDDFGDMRCAMRRALAKNQDGWHDTNKLRPSFLTPRHPHPASRPEWNPGETTHYDATTFKPLGTERLVLPASNTTSPSSRFPARWPRLSIALPLDEEEPPHGSQELPVATWRALPQRRSESGPPAHSRSDHWRSHWEDSYSTAQSVRAQTGNPS